jgi:hypothetical protein
VRAKAILLAAQGLRNDQIADRIALPRQIISKWRKSFFEERLDGLENLPRPRRPPVFAPLNWSCRSKPWRASYPINTACLYRATAAGTWFGKSPAGVWWPASAAGPSGAGWMRTPSDLGSTAVGF